MARGRRTALPESTPCHDLVGSGRHQLKSVLRRLVQYASPRGAFVVFLAVASALFLVWQMWAYRDQLASQEFRVRWEFIPVSAIFYCADLLLVVRAWAELVASVGVRLPFGVHFRYFCIANFGRRLPGTVWYVLGRNLLYARHGAGSGVVTLASTLELGIALASGVTTWIAATSLRLQDGALALAAACIAFAAIGIARRAPLLGSNSRLASLHVIGGRFSGLARSFLLYVAAWTVGGLILYSVAGVVADVSLDSLMYLVACWSFAGVVSMAAFFLPANLGITEVSLSVTVAQIMPPPLAVLVAILMRILITVYEIGFAAIAGAQIVQVARNEQQ